MESTSKLMVLVVLIILILIGLLCLYLYSELGINKCLKGKDVKNKFYIKLIPSIIIGYLIVTSIFTLFVLVGKVDVRINYKEKESSSFFGYKNKEEKEDNVKEKEYVDDTVTVQEYIEDNILNDGYYYSVKNKLPYNKDTGKLLEEDTIYKVFKPKYIKTKTLYEDDVDMKDIKEVEKQLENFKLYKVKSRIVSDKGIGNVTGEDFITYKLEDSDGKVIEIETSKFLSDKVSVLERDGYKKEYDYIDSNEINLELDSVDSERIIGLPDYLSIDFYNTEKVEKESVKGKLYYIIDINKEELLNKLKTNPSYLIQSRYFVE